MLVEVTYIDGTIRSAPLADWPHLRREAVDRVAVVDGRYRTERHGASLYWLYPEAGRWVFGSGSIRYDPNDLEEVVFSATDSTVNQVRRRRYLPDLTHDRIKLGWWNGQDLSA